MIEVIPLLLQLRSGSRSSLSHGFGTGLRLVMKKVFVKVQSFHELNSYFLRCEFL